MKCRNSNNLKITKCQPSELLSISHIEQAICNHTLHYHRHLNTITCCLLWRNVDKVNISKSTCKLHLELALKSYVRKRKKNIIFVTFFSFCFFLFFRIANRFNRMSLRHQLSYSGPCTERKNTVLPSNFSFELAKNMF